MNTEEEQDKAIRVSLIASKGSFEYEKESSGKVFIMRSNEVKEHMFNFIVTNPAKTNMPFFSVVGMPNDVNGFLNSSLYYCGVNP